MGEFGLPKAAFSRLMDGVRLRLWSVKTSVRSLPRLKTRENGQMMPCDRPML